MHLPFIVGNCFFILIVVYRVFTRQNVLIPYLVDRFYISRLGFTLVFKG